MPDSFNSAGADASTGILAFLANLDAQRRQQKLDALTAQQQQFEQHIKLRDMTLKEQKEQRETEQHKADLAERAAQHATQAEQTTQNIRDKKTQNVEKRLGNMIAGDYPDAQLIQDMDELGMGASAPKPPQAQQSLPGVVAPNAPAVPAGIRVAPPVSPTGGLSPEPPAQMGLTGTSDPAVRPYAGAPKERDQRRKDQELDAFITSLPEGSNERKMAESARYNAKITAAGLKLDQAGATDNSQAVFRQSPRSGSVERLVNGQWVAWNGDVPKGSHFMTEPAPAQSSFQLQPEVDPKTGAQTGRFFSFDTKNNRFSLVDAPTGGPAGTKAAPGAAQAVTKEASKKEAQTTIEHMKADIDEADKAGLIGPTAGRVSDLERMIGSSNPVATRLAGRMIAAKMQVDAGIGGMRAAASPALLKRWDDILSAKMSKENLLAAAQVMQDMVGGSAHDTPDAATNAPATPAPKRVRYGMDGKVIP